MCLSVHLGALAIEAHLGTKKSAQGVVDLCSASRASSSYKKRGPRRLAAGTPAAVLWIGDDPKTTASCNSISGPRVP